MVFSTMSNSSSYTVYDDVHPVSDQLPSSYPAFCAVTGFLDVLCELSELLYVISFSLYYIRRIRNPLKGTSDNNQDGDVGAKRLIFCSV